MSEPFALAQEESPREKDPVVELLTKKPAVRHAEKRRQSTCRFADRVAQLCVSQYRKCTPASFRETQKQTCIAAIVAHFQPKDESNDNDIDKATKDDQLRVLGMGVGTKFLSQAILLEESDSTNYGTRVRDCHAEVLARRAFRRYLLLEILSLQRRGLSKSDGNGASIGIPSILQQQERDSVNASDGSLRYCLKPGVTLHMYASSAPCGNSTLKKFATMKKECFRDDLNGNEWPRSPHEPIQGHSVALGQFALLVKKDPAASQKHNNTAIATPVASPSTAEHGLNKRHKTTTTAAIRNNETIPSNQWPAHQSTDWCPPGTSTVWAQRGSLHTCSDKLCRWNCLGLQGSLLASLLVEPIYVSSITVGRKLTECICRRAVCCRAAGAKKEKKTEKAKQRGVDSHTTSNGRADICRTTTASTDGDGNPYQLHHPAIMGTAIYMDEDGVIDMTHHDAAGTDDQVIGQDVRFHSSLSWAWWPQLDTEAFYESCNDNTAEGSAPSQAECIDGATGLALVASTAQDQPTTTRELTTNVVSRISTAALSELYGRVCTASGRAAAVCLSPTGTSSLSELRAFKRKASPVYEAQKAKLMAEHRLFRQWKRREHSSSLYTGST